MGRRIKDLTKDGTWEIKGNDEPSMQTLGISCLMRIADATELMAQNYVKMQNDLNWYKKKYAEQKAEIEELKFSRAGHKAAFTKLKNKVAEKNDESENN